MEIPPAVSVVSPMPVQPRLATPHWRFLLLLSTAVIGLIVLVFFLFEGNQRAILNGKRVILPIDVAGLLVNDPVKNRAYGLLVLATTTTDPKQKSQDLIKAYNSLTISYQASPEAMLRIQIQKLYTYLQKNYPSETKRSNLAVPCFELSCGYKVVYSDDLNIIKKDILALKIDQSVQKNFLQGVDTVAGSVASNNKAAIYSGLQGIFFSLKNYSTPNNSSQLKPVVSDVLGYMNKVDPYRYALESKLNLYVIK